MGDAPHLPCRGGAIDLVVFVTTLEFLEQPVVALAGGASRPPGARAGGAQPLESGRAVAALGTPGAPAAAGAAQDYSVGAMRARVRQALGERRRGLHWTSTLFPNGLWQCRAPVPLGEVLGMAVVLATLSGRPEGQ